MIILDYYEAKERLEKAKTDGVLDIKTDGKISEQVALCAEVLLKTDNLKEVEMTSFGIVIEELTKLFPEDEKITLFLKDSYEAVKSYKDKYLWNGNVHQPLAKKIVFVSEKDLEYQEELLGNYNSASIQDLIDLWKEQFIQTKEDILALQKQVQNYNEVYEFLEETQKKYNLGTEIFIEELWNRFLKESNRTYQALLEEKGKLQSIQLFILYQAQNKNESVEDYQKEATKQLEIIQNTLEKITDQLNKLEDKYYVLPKEAQEIYRENALNKDVKNTWKKGTEMLIDLGEYIDVLEKESASLKGTNTSSVAYENLLNKEYDFKQWLDYLKVKEDSIKRQVEKLKKEIDSQNILDLTNYAYNDLMFKINNKLGIASSTLSKYSTSIKKENRKGKPVLKTKKGILHGKKLAEYLKKSASSLKEKAGSYKGLAKDYIISHNPFSIPKNDMEEQEEIIIEELKIPELEEELEESAEKQEEIVLEELEVPEYKDENEIILEELEVPEYEEETKSSKEKESLLAQKAYLEALKKKIPWALGGVAVGLGASIVVPSVGLSGVGAIRITYSAAKFANKVVSKGFLGGKPTPVDKVIDLAKETVKEKYGTTKIYQKAQAMNQFLKKPEVQWFINGVSVGYLAGNILNLHDKVFDGAKNVNVPKGTTEQLSDTSTVNPSPEPEVPTVEEPTLPNVPTGARGEIQYDWLKTGETIDLSNVHEGFKTAGDVVNRTNATSLLSEYSSASNNTMIEFFRLADGSNFTGSIQDLLDSGIDLNTVAAKVVNQNGVYGWLSAQDILDTAETISKGL